MKDKIKKKKKMQVREKKRCIDFGTVLAFYLMWHTNFLNFMSGNF